MNATDLADRTMDYFSRNGELPLSGWGEDELWLARHFDGSDDHSNTLWAYCQLSLEAELVDHAALAATLDSAGL